MNYYVFRIDYGKHHNTMRNEILRGRLRQGWGGTGMNVNQDIENYIRAWRTVWPDSSADDGYIRRKYSNISIMKEMREGDYIVIPKLNINNEEDWRSFTVVRVKGGGYKFELLDDTGDFGHWIEVEVVFSCAYLHNEESRNIIAKFRSYQRAITRIHDREIIEAINRLFQKSNSGYFDMSSECMTSLEAIIHSTTKARAEYIGVIVEQIQRWKPDQLEKATEELFRKNGYELISRNSFDKKGGDIDLLFAAYNNHSLVRDILAMSGTEVPEIRIQLKKKVGIDQYDVEGVKQLAISAGSERAINILINLADEFTEEAQKAAKENDIVLINGRQYASLLIRYGLDSIIQ